MPKLSKKQSKSSCRSRTKERDQWIVIAPESAVDCAAGCSDPVFVKLRHPKTDKAAMFFFSSDGSSVHEVLRFKRDFGSWFINELVQQDGSLEMVTPVDPLFLALPYLLKSSQQRNKFMTLDQILHDEEFPQCIRLLHCAGMASIDRVAEVRGSGDVRAYRYDESRALEWLRDKVAQTVACLGQTDVHVACGAQSTTFVRSTKDQGASHEDYQRYAAGLVSDYLSPELSKQLYGHLGITEVSVRVAKPEEQGTEPPTKKARLSSDKSEPDEDYSNAFTANGSDKKNEKKASKMSSAQKALSKVDTKQMKSISSFFSKKSKK